MTILSSFSIQKGGPPVKKKWIVFGAIVVFLFAAAFSLWLEKPVLMQKLSETVTVTADEKLNGTLRFSSMDVSLSGRVTIADPVVRDTQGRTVLSGKDITVFINPWKVLSSLSGGEMAAAVETVDIQAPVVHIWQNQADQTWNVANLVKNTGDTTDAGFRGRILLHDGTVRLQLPNGPTLVGEQGEGTLDFSSYPRLYADAALYLDGEKVTASGHFTSARDFDVLVKGDAVKAAYLSPFIPADTDVTITDGTIRDIRAHYAQTHNGRTLSGSASVEGGAGTAYGIACSDVKGDVRLTTDTVYLEKASGTLNGQQVEAGGLIRINTDTPVFQLDVTVPGADLSAFTAYLPEGLTGSVAFKGRLWGTTDQLSAAGTVQVPQLDYNGLSISNGQADISCAGSDIAVTHVTAAVAGGSLTGSGTYNRESSDFHADLQAEGIQLEAIPQLPASMLGTVSATLQAAGNVQSGQVTAKGQASATGLSYNGLEADTATTDFAYADGVISLSQLTASVQGGTVTANGTYDTKNKDLNGVFTAKDIPLSMFAGYAAVPMSGTISAAGQVFGTGPAWNVIFHAANGSIKDMPFDSLDGSLSGTGSQIQIPSVVWWYKDGTHQASGQVNLDSRSLQLQVTTQHMRLERLLPALGKGELPLTGWADNTVYVSGTLDNLAAHGSFRLSSGSAYGYLYKNVSADYTLANNTIYLQNGDISAYDASVKVSGSVGERLNLDFDASNLDIARLVPQKGPQRAGLVHLKAHVGGTLDSPTLNGTLQSDQLTFNQTLLQDVKGEVTYYGGIFHLNNFHFMQNGGSYDANGGYNPANGWIMARASVASGDLASLLKLAGYKGNAVQGRLDGNLSVDGTAEKPRAHLTGQLTQGFIGKEPIEPTDIDVQYENDTVKINKLALQVSGGILAAQGTYALHGPVNIQVAGRGFPTKLLTEITGRTDIDLDSNVDFAVTLSGTGDDPNADVSIQLNGGTMKGFSFTNAYALLNIRNGIIKLSQAYIAKDPYKVSAYGTIPMAAISGARTDESMDVTLKLDHASLDLLTFVSPLIKTATGNLEGTLQVKGTAAAPEVYGTVGVKDGSVSIEAMQYPLSQIQGQVQFTGTQAALTTAAVMDKKNAKNPGNVQIQGNAAWNGWELTQYGGTLNLNHLNVQCPYFKGPLNGELKLSDEEGYPLLSGKITLSHTDLDVPLSLSSSNSSMDLGLDLTIEMGDEVRLYNPALYDMTLTGSANFSGTLMHPYASGGFEAMNGTFHYLDTNFHLSKAKATFNQPDTFLPYVDVEGETRVGQYNVLLNLRGPVEKMDLMLRSNPPLTKNQIISLITLRNSGDKQSSSLTGEDVNTLIGSGIRMTLNSLGITQTLEKALHLDMLTVTTGSLDYDAKTADINDNYYNIEMGKYLFNDFMVTAAFGLNHQDNRIGMQYNLGSKFGLAAWKSSEGAYVGGVYKYSFY